ncbi:DUF2786 domain-containing protein [Morganella psychrotolerans]|uniref:DUF2786 domain-containing protein n=1 Tax=Morganella psychrotolerans TaxID=368603 RepID=UPI0039B01EFE
MMTDRDKAIAKVQKLMSLAENAGNENEAANAFAKARLFMKKHSLSLSDIYAAESALSPSVPPEKSPVKPPSKPMTAEGRHREMGRQKQQEEQRLRELQALVAQQRQRELQRQREQQALRELEKRQAIKKQQQQTPLERENQPEPVRTEPQILPQQTLPQQPPIPPEFPHFSRDKTPSESNVRQLIISKVKNVLAMRNIPLLLIAAVMIFFVIYIVYLQ